MYIYEKSFIQPRIFDSWRLFRRCVSQSVKCNKQVSKNNVKKDVKKNKLFLIMHYTQDANKVSGSTQEVKSKLLRNQ